jgi:hypothetical protein
MIDTFRRCISVGGTGFSVTCFDQSLHGHLDRICTEFFSAELPEYELFIASRRVPQRAVDYVLRVEEFSCLLDTKSKTAAIDFNGAPSSEITAAALAHLCMVVSLLKGAVLFHASAVVKNGSAYIFAGPSGAGKSTIARVSAPMAVLSQELIGITKDAETVLAFALPYAGDAELNFRANGRVAVAGMFKLVKDRMNTVRLMSRPQALAEFFTIPEAAKPIISQEEYFRRYCEVIASVACYELHFKPDDSFWRILDGHHN